MQDYPDPHQHFDNYLGHAARKYADGLQKANLEPSPILDRAMSRRVSKEAQADYEEQISRVLVHNLSELDKKYKPREDRIRRTNAIARMIICPVGIILCSIICWYAFNLHVLADMLLGVMFGIVLLVFLTIWIFGGRIDR